MSIKNTAATQEVTTTNHEEKPNVNSSSKLLFGRDFLIDIAGICTDITFILKEALKIEECLDNGESYNDIFNQFAYEDCFTGNLALLIVAEERFNTKITSAEQWQEVAQLNPEFKDWIRNSFYIALEALYYMAIKKTLRDGGVYSDLLKFNPEEFGLPNKWEGIFNQPRSKEILINQALHHHIDKFFLSGSLEAPTFYNVADQLKAPLNVVINAAQFYD